MCLFQMMSLDNAENTVTILVNPEVGISKNEILTKEERSTIYSIQRFNGSPGLRHWGYRDTDNETFAENTRCNTIEGALEGGIFPPNVKANSTFRMYRRAFCRPVEFRYEEEITTKAGYRGFNFRVANNFLGTPEENPDNGCYCYNGKCPVSGMGLLTPCYYTIPVSISQPHFYNADPSLIAQTTGLKPDKEKHDSVVTIHPDMGVPLNASLRIQINLHMPETKFNSRTRPFNKMSVPLFWLELAVEDVPTLVNICIKMFFHILPVVFMVLTWVFGLLGVAMIGTSALVILYLPQPTAPFEDPYGSIDYSPIRIIKMPQYFLPDIKISK